MVDGSETRQASPSPDGQGHVERLPLEWLPCSQQSRDGAPMMAASDFNFPLASKSPHPLLSLHPLTEQVETVTEEQGWPLVRSQPGMVPQSNSLEELHLATNSVLQPDPFLV